MAGSGESVDLLWTGERGRLIESLSLALLVLLIEEPPVSTDHNLLFGVLALQADILDAKQFAEACSAWASRKDTPLADLLVERRWLTDEERAHVEYLLQRKLKKNGDARASLAAVATAEVRSVLESVADADVRRSLAGLPTPAGPVPPSTVAYHPDARQRYTLTRLHARGGIGQVWFAHDEDLGRDVALKELRPDRRDDPAAAARFLQEARITGQLEHPGVVPVYELVQPRDGEPCYAMRFVGGRTLADAVKEYHRKRQSGEAGPLDLRELLTAYVGVCNAVGYAHSRGVLHRDLKPANVALGDFGEVLVLDWGLAKVVGNAEEPTSLLPVSVGQADGRGETRQGQVLGTPAYMPPEQATGRVDLADRRSDVYGLGAILYEILTGAPPFSGADAQEVLRRVVQEPVVPPRKLVPTIPPALQAVCLRALAKVPEARYGSARELAREVVRWLSDEPVTAYREPLAQRLGRWVRRHRTGAASAAALLVTAVAGLAVGLVAVNAERANTVQANAALAVERDQKQAALEAEQRRRRQAREALDAMSSEVIDDWLAKQRELTEPQKQFLQKALAMYEAFARDTGQDEPARAGIAAAYGRVGNIRSRLGQLAQAEAAYRTSQEGFAHLAADFPAVPAYRQELALGHNNLGALLQATGRAKEAEGEYRQALDLYRRLADDSPAVPAYRQEQARSHNNLGALLQATGRAKEAEGEYRMALDLYQRLADGFPAVPAYRQELAASYNNLGNLLDNTGRAPEAERVYRKALALAQRLADDSPSVPADRQYLAGSHLNLGLLLQNTGRSKEAEGEYRQAVDLYRRLADDSPSVPDYRQQLANGHNYLGYLLGNAGHVREAEGECRQALALQQRLADDFPKAPGYRRDLAGTHTNLGALLQGTGRAQEAEAEHAKALAIRKRLADDFPKAPDYQNDVAGTLGNLALLALGRQDFVRARRLLEEALPYHRAALKANPRHPEYRTFFRNNTEALVTTLLHLGAHAEAASAADRLAEAAVDPPEDLYNAACFLARCAPVAEKDEKLPEARRKEVAKNYADRALAALREAVAKGYKDVEHMKKDSDLDPLRGRDDFKKLVAELESAGREKKP
jgi:tetratricopeptide (TPR) repeat protein/tRNA A-37 threonylcarbamoyl transferase component Bud32